MKISDLLETDVRDENGTSLGKIRDVHVRQDGPLDDSGQAALRVHGFVAGRFAIATRLGYINWDPAHEQPESRGPAPLRAMVRWLHRHARYVPWSDIVTMTKDHIIVKWTAP